MDQHDLSRPDVVPLLHPTRHVSEVLTAKPDLSVTMGADSASASDLEQIGSGGSFGVEASAVALLVCPSVASLLLIAAKRKGNVIQPFWSARCPAGQVA
jgi:hypothetical protein